MPTVSITEVGIFVVILLALLQFYFSFARHKRDEAGSVQAKISPPVHEQIETRVKTTEERFSKSIDHVHGRISGLRAEIQLDLKQNAAEVRGTMEEMRTIYTDTVGKIGHLEGTQQQLNQRQTSTERKLDQHIHHLARKKS